MASFVWSSVDAFFAGSPFEVELEKDLSLQQQFLDVVIIKKHEGSFPEKLPDGIDDLVDHNLLSYKSLNEPLDDWALKELTGHYVNYRKQILKEHPLPEEAFRLYGVSTRFPKKLAKILVFHKLQDGVYNATRGSDVVRIIVLREIQKKKHNAFWHLFSAEEDNIKYGVANFKLRESNASTILKRLVKQYTLEGLNMPFSVEQFTQELEEEFKQEIKEKFKQEIKEEFKQEIKEEFKQEIFKEMTAEDWKQILTSLTPEKRREILDALTENDPANPNKPGGKGKPK